MISVPSADATTYGVYGLPFMVANYQKRRQTHGRVLINPNIYHRLNDPYRARFFILEKIRLQTVMLS